MAQQNNSQQRLTDDDEFNQHLIQQTTGSQFLQSQLTTNPTTNQNSNIARVIINSERSHNNNGDRDNSSARPVANATIEPIEQEESDTNLSQNALRPRTTQTNGSQSQIYDFHSQDLQPVKIRQQVKISTKDELFGIIALTQDKGSTIDVLDQLISNNDSPLQQQKIQKLNNPKSSKNMHSFKQMKLSKSRTQKQQNIQKMPELQQIKEEQQKIEIIAEEPSPKDKSKSESYMNISASNQSENQIKSMHSKLSLQSHDNDLPSLLQANRRSTSKQRQQSLVCSERSSALAQKISESAQPAEMKEGFLMKTKESIGKKTKYGDRLDQF